MLKKEKSVTKASNNHNLRLQKPWRKWRQPNFQLKALVAMAFSTKFFKKRKNGSRPNQTQNFKGL